MCRELQIFAFVYVYLGASQVFLDFGITPVDDITIGITWTAFCLHIAHIIITTPTTTTTTAATTTYCT